LDEAFTHYRRLLELEPSNTTAHNNLGYIHWQQGRIVEAIAEYEATLHIDPADANARAALAKLRR
jgi:Flp pilus assembly protein TadD